MYISEIKLTNFKKFSNAKFMFDKGINIIKGSNEQGKSTLLKAIIAGFFVDPSSVKYRELFRSWNQDTLPEIEVDFFHNGNFYSISKNFNTKEVVLRDVVNVTEEKNLVVIQNKIKEIIGVGNENLLKSTACIYHDEMAMIESGKKSLDEALQDISINAGKTNILELLRSLSAKIEEMQVGLYRPAKNNGIIKKLQDEILERTTELDSLKTKENDVESASDKLTSLTKELGDVENQLVKYTKAVADFEKRDNVQKEIDVLNEKIKNATADLTKVNDFSEKIKTIEKKLEALGGVAVLEVMDSRQQDIIAINNQIKVKQEEFNDLKVEQVTPIKKETKNHYGAMITVTAVTALGFVLIGLVLSLLFLVIIGLGAAVVGFALIFLLKGESNVNDEDEIQNARAVTLQNEMQEMAARLNAFLEECRVTTIEEFFAKRTQLIALHSDYIQTKSTVDAILRGKDYDAINEKLMEDIQKKKELEVEIPEGDVIPRDQYMRDKRELELLNLDKKDIQNEIVEEKAKIKIVNVSPEEVREKEGKLAELQKQLVENTHHLEVLQIVFDALSKAKEDISKNVSENIQKYVEKSLPKITNGRYESMKMDSNFNIQVFSKEKNEWINPNNHLSKGTIDQIYLSARLALADIITGGKPIPLFFDDPFVTFDEGRRNALMEEMRGISEAHQVFIFTCHDFFNGYGKVINIEEL